MESQMDEFNNGLTEDREFSQPESSAEYTVPAPETEFSQVSYEAVHSSQKESGMRKVRRMAYYAAAAAVSLGLLTATPPEPPKEIVEINDPNVTDFAVVKPEDPCTLYYNGFIYYNDVQDEAYEEFISKLSDMTFIDSGFYLVTPDGTETKLEPSPVSEFYRSAFVPGTHYSEDGSFDAYYLSEDGDSFMIPSGMEGYGNLDSFLESAAIEPFQEGSMLKEISSYEYDGKIYRLSASRNVEWLPPEQDIDLSVDIEPGDGTYSEMNYRLLFHPQSGDDHEYIFGEYDGFVLDEDWINDRLQYFFLASDQGLMAIPSFCTRWYDENGNFLKSGWTGIAERDIINWPYPSMERSGNDYIFTYSGPVRSDAADPAAAYYSIELMLIDASNGWKYIIESEKFPVTG